MFAVHDVVGDRDPVDAGVVGGTGPVEHVIPAAGTVRGEVLEADRETRRHELRVCNGRPTFTASLLPRHHDLIRVAGVPPVRLAVVSDTHLSRRAPEAQAK